MFRVLARHLVAVFAVLIGVLAIGGAARAQAPDRAIYGYQAPVIDPQVQPLRQKRVQVRHSRKAHAVLHHRSAKAHRRAHHVRVATRRSAPALIAPRTGAAVEARVDLSSQRMVVTVGGEVAHVWHVSTARKGYVTPRGVYSPKRMHVSYFSKKYYNSPMPYSIFFSGGYAVHGTGAIKALGRPASHGCIRLATGNARTLFNLVKQHGAGRARIVIS